MIRYRPFRNTDPVQLADVWQSCQAGRALMQPMSTQLWEDMVFCKPYFDRQGLLVAEEDDHLAGFVHAGFGPTPDGRGLSHDVGYVCMLLVRPESRGRGIGSQLLQRAEDYLRSRGSRQVYVGGANNVEPFYLGLYSGSGAAGVLDSLAGADTFLQSRQFRRADRATIWQCDLTDFIPKTDRTHIVIRRSTQVEVFHDPQPDNWWTACTYGGQERLQFVLVGRPKGQKLAWATVWLLQPLGFSWGTRVVELHELHVEPPHRRAGLATCLVGEVFRKLRELGFFTVRVHTTETNAAGNGLVRKIGFQPHEHGGIYVKP